MFETTKTIYSSMLEQCQKKQQVYTPMAYSTLNELFSVQPDATYPNGTYPQNHYVAAGRGAHLWRQTTDNKTAIGTAVHSPTDAALYEHIPFIIRPVSNDLTVAERTGYGMRTLITVSGVDYFAYYLKRIPFDTALPIVEIVTTIDGVSTSEEYTATSSQLHPTAIATDANAIVVGQTLASVATNSEFVITASDVAEMMEACLTIYGDPGLAVISEMAVVQAVPTQVDSTLGGINITYEEAVGAQIAAHVPVMVVLEITSRGFRQTYSEATDVPLRS